MLTFRILAFMAIVVGVFRLLGLKFTDLFRDFINRPQSIRTQINEATNRKKKRFVIRQIEEISEIMRLTDREDMAEKISIADNENEILVDDSMTLSCKFLPENTTNKEVEWKSDNENIIAVTAEGKITGKGVGKAVITAKHKELTDSITMEVKPIEADKVEIILPEDIEMKNETEPRMKKGTSIQLSSLIEPENTTYKDIEWSVSDEGIATIDEDGILTAHSTGIVVVTVTTRCGKTDEVGIEIYSNVGWGITGIGGIITAIGAGIYLKKKKKPMSLKEEAI